MPATAFANFEEILIGQNQLQKTLGYIFSNANSYMRSDDFAFMLEKEKGTYYMMGNEDSYIAEIEHIR